MKLVFIDETCDIDPAVWDAIQVASNGEITIVDYKTKEDHMFNRRIALGASLAAMVGALGTGVDRLTQVAVANSNINTFTQRYGNNPRSLNGNTHRNSKAAQQKRVAKKRRNIRARASKRA